MAEEFQAGICGGSWWNPARSHVFMGGSSPCSVMNSASDVGTYGSWVTDMVDLKARSCKESNNSVSDDSSIVFQSSKTPQHSTNTDSDNSGGSASGSILIDSTLQMMGFGISSPLSSSDWNQNILRGRGESYNFMLQEDMNSSLNSSQQQKDWSPKSFTSTTGTEDSTITAFKAINHQDFSLDQQQQGLNHVSTTAAAGNSIATTCQGFSMGSSGSYGGYHLQGLFEPDPQPQQSLFNNRSTSGYGTSLNELSHNWPKLSPLLKPSLPKQQQQQLPNSLHFSNNTPFWNASANSFLSSSQPQILLPSFEEKPSCTNITSKGNNNSEEVVKKASSEPAMKRARIETPSPLPTFKVRKEKLGDRITALQQLVSPFGKTDTASVLHEAIEYIKFLHDQVNVLSTPYMKNNNAIQPQQCGDKLKEAEAAKQDLRSRGLCLVPVSSTFPVANETTADFWTPTFGGTFR